MGRWAANIVHLGLKELASVWRDRGMMVFIIWAFTGAIYLVASGASTEMRNASVGFVDGDQSQLSNRIRDAVRPPDFAPPVSLDRAEIDHAMDSARFTFIIDVPPRFEQDLLAGRSPTLQVIVDATAMTQAGIGTGYFSQIVNGEIERFLELRGRQISAPIAFTIRAFFNPNLEDKRHMAVMEIVNNVCMLSIILVGAAVVREREHGTIEHLLVMPVRASEIVFAKIWANGLVVLVAVLLSLIFVAKGALGITINGSIAVYMMGAVVFIFAVMALGIMLATITPSMPQFALLAFPTVIVMEVLSGGMTPIESMPGYLQMIMSAVPSTHYVKFSLGVLFRDAPLSIVWHEIAWMAALGAIYLVIALGRFRAMLENASGA
ncbi:ABC transporter permease [Bosea psychrotolerans]|uniref:ABC-2 type transport system permease protein n=1 Tax=Bosea psychrotolerans TaxID=1871628 RepID=A0A2S4LXM3_9HYPH|nr:ABC transporter permease [Bosea psychrotolerans]POR47119.1 ABC-2 type transport system permease protein [Bosea psychrotolerans]